MQEKAKQPKKLAVIYILKILQDYTDEQNRLTQTEIVDLLQEDYGMSLDRKSVRHNLSKLMEAGYPIYYKEDVTRIGAGGVEQTIKSDWYYDHAERFELSELRVMIDSLLYANGLPQSQLSRLIGKIADLGSSFERNSLRKARAVLNTRPDNKQMFNNVGLITEAVEAGKMIRFNYGVRGLDGKLHAKEQDGKPKLYTVTPRKMVLVNGRYYLIASRTDATLTHFRVDRIMNISRTDEKASRRSVRQDDLRDYVAEHPYMWTGEVCHGSFRCPEWLIPDIIDTFGTGYKVMKQENGNIEVSVRVGMKDLEQWGMHYCDQVEILYPSEVREAVAKTMKEAAARYGG
ncbi:MAG: WYL domain-containing protein [Ruminococcus sp.]|nr:WYL domain-containing protein [Ruminococcus sp.]